MVIALGSMAIKGVFKAGELVSGLAKTMTGLKQTQKEGKSTDTEMKRMTGTTKKLAGALALIGAGGFTALMMTAPQLSASLFRIKMQLRMMAWTIGRHLKPLLDAVGKILKGIRTGDWSMFFAGLSDAWEAAKGLIATAWQWIKNVYNGLWEWLETQGIEKPEWVKSVEKWILELERIITEKDWDALWDWGKAPFVALYDKVVENRDIFVTIGVFIWGVIWDSLVAASKSAAWNKLMEGATWLATGGDLPGVAERFEKQLQDDAREKLYNDAFGFYYEATGTEYEDTREKQVGGMIPVTGMYQMHAGEEVIPSGTSSPSLSHGGDTSITLDFTGARFQLGNDTDIQSFAENISEIIAAKQQDVNY